MSARPFQHPSLASAGGSSAARADAAYDHIKMQLLEGDYGPGQKLSVVDLTRELACSRVPVMEALKRLAGAGFVHIVPQVGCRVVTPQPAETHDTTILGKRQLPRRADLVRYAVEHGLD